MRNCIESQDAGNAAKFAQHLCRIEPTYEPEQRYRMVGRDAQLEDLRDLLHRAKNGQGAVAAILGHPGAGKSRLVQETFAAAASLGFETKVFQGNRSLRKSTFAPILDQAFRSGALAGGQVTPVAIKAWLVSLGPELDLAAPYIGSLIADLTTDDPQLPVSAKTAAANIFASQALRATTDRPLCLVFEDVHWFDPTTCEAIANLIEAITQTPVLALLVSRSGEAPDIVHHPVVRRVNLEPLQRDDAEALLRGMLGDVTTPDHTVRNVLERAEGNPLVLEEFAKSIVFAPEAAAGDQIADDARQQIETPNRLLPLLLSRIDSVPGAIEILQFASVFGRKFFNDQLANVSGSSHHWTTVSAALEDAGIIFATTLGSDTSFLFKHALIGEAIYATIPKRQRPAMHIAAAQTLLVDKQRIMHSEVAHHFKSAGVHDQAAQYFERSGDHAARVSANAEAISEYHDALAMIVQTPQADERLRRELALNRKIAAQMIALHGIPTAQVTRYYATAQTLSAQLGDDAEYVNGAWGLWSIHLIVAELDQCLETASELAPMIDKLQSSAATIIYHYMLGVTHAYRGSLSEAAIHLDTVLDLYDDALKDELQMRFGMDIGLTANSFLGWVYALLGRHHDADQAATRAIARALTNDNGLGHVFANVFAATKCLFQDQLQDARKHAQIAFEGADAMGFKHWSAQARIQLARVADLSGDVGALAEMQQAREAYMSTGMVLARPYADVWVAAAQNRSGQPQQALDTLDALQDHTNNTNQKYYDFAAQSTRTLAANDLSKAGK